MKLEFNLNSLIINGNILLSPFQSKNKLISENLPWEEWIRNDNEVVSCRIILVDKKSKSKVFLIVTFISPINDNSLLCSWYLSPENLMNGEQKKPEGKVTKSLRKWFFDKTKVEIPIGGDWGHIDAVYDHWNTVGVIACNYRYSFKSESEWEKYRKINEF
ncbi:hypothetical protein [Erwinia amylovora]|uniref:hypothetical protein n=1 Tax=Erwinia amylovora TaxID=552 RepID=UPI004059414F